MGWTAAGPRAFPGGNHPGDANARAARRVVDEVLWVPSKSGAFSLASAYQEVRQARGRAVVFAQIWHDRIPLKISFFMLRLLMRRLPLDDVLREMGFQLPSKCWCCEVAGEESLDHVFSRGQIAMEVCVTAPPPPKANQRFRRVACPALAGTQSFTTVLK